MSEIDAINEALEAEMEQWAEAFLMNRATHLRRKKIEASGDLIESMQYDMGRTATNDAVRLLIAFNDYGRIIDMRSISHDKWGRNAVTRVEDWIKNKGLLEKWIPKFMEKYKLKTIPHNILNRMAWGVPRKRTYAWRPKKWYNKAKEGAINDLYNDVAASMPDRAGEVFEKTLTPKEQARVRARFRAYAKAKGRI